MALATPPGGGPRDAHVGRKAVDLGLITAQQLADVLLQLSNARTPPSVSAALVSGGLLTERQVEVLVEGSGAAPTRLGKYRILRELGRGGMGVVYEAEDQELHRRVALKMLLSSLHADAQEAAPEEERFIRESRLSANLPKHPHVVGVYEAGIVEGRRYIAMEFIEGRQYSDWRLEKSITTRQQIAVLRDVALAVDHAHRHGVIHRDLKPQNILVDAESHPHVTDFGLAKRAASRQATLALTVSGQIMGTPAYMSPEQAEGRKDVDRRSDVWALGVMLYEILAGRLPFSGQTPLEILMKVVKEPVTPPSARGNVDRTIEKICLKALAKDPKDRYHGARGLADDLSHWLKGHKVEVSSPRRKLPRFWIIGGAVAAAVVAAIAFLALRPSTGSDHDHAAWARDYVAQGRELMRKGRYADAIVSFHRAAEEDPTNRAAAAGKKEAEEKLVAMGRREEKPAPVAPPPPPPAPTKVEGPAPAEDAARKERERKAAELQRRERIQKELGELDLTLRSLRGAESFGPAREILLQAALRHEEADWKEAVASRLGDLKQAVAALLAPLKEQAAESKRKGDATRVEALRSRVGGWTWPEAAIELDESIARIAPAPAPPTPPVVPTPAAGAVEKLTLKVHGSGVHVLALLPDGKSALTGGFDNIVRLWDLESRSERKELVKSVMPVSGAASADGRWIAAGLFDGSLRIWDVARLQARVFTHTGQVTGVAFTPDAKLVATSCVDGRVRLWDTATGTPKFQSEQLFHKGAMCLALSLDGKTMAAGGADRQVRVFDVPSGQERKRFENVHADMVCSIAVSPGGKWVLTGGTDKTVILIDVIAGRRTLFTFNAEGKKDVRQVAFSPDGKWALAASTEGTIIILEPVTGTRVATFKESDGFFSAAFSRGGDLLVAGTAGGSLRIWDLKPLRSTK